VSRGERVARPRRSFTTAVASVGTEGPNPLFTNTNTNTNEVTFIMTAVDDDDVDSLNELDALDVDNDTKRTELKVYRLPVTLYKDETTGEQFFYLQKSTFPGKSITDLKIRYTESEKSQVKEQVSADKNCPEIILRNAQVECRLTGITENDDPNAILKDESFRLSGSKIG
jgi:hypothetical protein